MRLSEGQVTFFFVIENIVAFNSVQVDNIKYWQQICRMGNTWKVLSNYKRRKIYKNGVKAEESVCPPCPVGQQVIDGDFDGQND